VIQIAVKLVLLTLLEGYNHVFNYHGFNCLSYNDEGPLPSCCARPAFEHDRRGSQRRYIWRNRLSSRLSVIFLCPYPLKVCASRPFLNYPGTNVIIPGVSQFSADTLHRSAGTHQSSKAAKTVKSAWTSRTPPECNTAQLVLATVATQASMLVCKVLIKQYTISLEVSLDVGLWDRSY
jgi:hypothetical protein